MSSLRKRVNAELERLRQENGGLLKQQAIVDFARKPDTALHEDFDHQGLWDDAVAAERARLDYAGRIMRLYLVPAKDDQKEPVRALVSLIQDRTVQSGRPGYRALEDVMEDESLQENLLQTALMELRAFRRKYERLKQLASIWDALDAVEVSAQKRNEERVSA